MRGKKAWRQVNHTSLSSSHTATLSYHLSPLSGPQFVVLQTPTLYFSLFNQAQVKPTHLPASLSLLPPHLVCPSHLSLLRSWPTGSSRGRAEKYCGESRGSTGGFLICHLGIVSKSPKMELCLHIREGSPGPIDMLRRKTRPACALPSLAGLNPHPRASSRPEFQHLHVTLLTRRSVSRHIIPFQQCPRQ